VWVSAEAAPWSKTGGLGDVGGSLPVALAERGHRVLAIHPAYQPVPGVRDTGLVLEFPLQGRTWAAQVQVLDVDGVRRVFLSADCYRRSGIYGNDRGPWPDNLLRYALLSRASLEVMRRVPAIDGELLGDQAVFHANDWHTALLPVYLEAHYRRAGLLRRSATVLGLHNLGHQGSQEIGAFADLDLPWFAAGTLEWQGRLNPLKAGVVASDALVAVSPTYAREIQEDQGFGLEPLLRARRDRLVGVVNGIGAEWDPTRDRWLPAAYHADDLSGKRVCKRHLQRACGLPERDVPLLGLVSRLDPQKGLDLVEAVAPWLLSQDVQLVMLGTGAERYQDFFREAERRWPSKVRARVAYSEEWAHWIEAGADVFLMPSRFEPCGLNQLYSLRYGTVPVVHATGGLADTVSSFHPSTDQGTGWAFAPYSVEAFQRALSFALLTWWEHPATWRRLQQRGMRLDLSWSASAERYEAIYRALLRERANL
jgi:starch synthase